MKTLIATLILLSSCATKIPVTQKEQSHAMAKEAAKFQRQNLTKENHKIITVFLVGVVCILHVKGYVE